jgi:hypothetical protein
VDRSELRRLAGSPDARSRAFEVALHPVELHEFDRVRVDLGLTRQEAVEEAVGLWVAREITRSARGERVALARRLRAEARAITEAAERRANELIEAAYERR